MPFAPSRPPFGELHHGFLSVSTSPVPEQSFFGADGGISDSAAAVLVVVSSIAFLVPARISFGIGWLWQTAVFTLMTVVCICYHVCDTALPVKLGIGAGCPDRARYSLTLADHGLAYFCVLQMAFLVLGPEDPAMQWIDHASVQNSPAFALTMPPPRDVVALTRVLPVVAITSYCCLFTSWDDFHWQSLILCDVLVMVSCTAFWLNPDRRSSILKVLIRTGFWRRVWRYGVLPCLMTSVVFICMQFFQSKALHAVWHLVVAAFAVNIIRTISGGSTGQSQDITDMSPRNPIIVRQLLGSAAVFGFSTLLASLSLDRFLVGEWRWPMVSMPTRQRPGGYLVAIGIMPTLLALAASFSMIRSTTAQPAAEQEVVVGKQLGCSVGHWSVAFGLLAVAANGSVFPTMHVVCLMVCLTLLQLAMVLTTLSSPRSSWRSLFTVAGCVAVTSFLMLLLLARGYVPNSYHIPKPLLALAEYSALAMPLLWPLCWGSEVQARWQSSKGWHSIWPNQLPHVS